MTNDTKCGREWRIRDKGKIMKSGAERKLEKETIWNVEREKAIVIKRKYEKRKRSKKE
jgi:hypothetical protein